MKVVVGLGNPEPRYENTRHNAGFRVIDRLATKSGAEFKSVKNFQADVAKTLIQRQEVLLVKPLTYMNLSGHAVISILNWYKLELSELLVIHDDVSLPLGRIRVQRAGGAGGQHGMESIIASLGGRKEFDRLKVGVGPDPGGDRRANFVLSAVPAVDAELYDTTISKCGEVVLTWLDKGLTTAMNTFNGMVFGVPEELQKKAEEQRLAKEKEDERKAAQKKAEEERLAKSEQGQNDEQNLSDRK